MNFQSTRLIEMLHVKLTWHKQVLPRMKSDDIHSLFIQECTFIPHLNSSALSWVLAGLVQTGPWAHLHIVAVQFGNLVYFFTCHRFQPLPPLPPMSKGDREPLHFLLWVCLQQALSFLYAENEKLCILLIWRSSLSSSSGLPCVQRTRNSASLW